METKKELKRLKKRIKKLESKQTKVSWRTKKELKRLKKRIKKLESKQTKVSWRWEYLPMQIGYMSTLYNQHDDNEFDY